MMICFVCNMTEKVRKEISTKITHFENAQRASGASISSKKREKYNAAIKKHNRDHGYYNCCLIFGIKINEVGDERTAIKESIAKLDNLINIVCSNKFK